MPFSARSEVTPSAFNPSIAEASIPFSDLSSASLHLHIGGPIRAGLGSVQVVVDGLIIEPVVLVSSHQVRVSGAGFDFVETVACDAGGEPMPAETVHEIDSFQYRFRSQVRSYRSSTSFARTVADIRQRCDREQVESVVVVSPDSPSALTAVAVQRTEAAWTTWHAYPGTSEIVQTWSALTPAPHSA